MKRSFIVTAGGIGTRMGAQIPKQFLLLNNKPILMHTLELLHNFDKVAELVVTLPKSYIDHWHELTEQHQFQIVHTIVPGGEERFHSIQKALKFCSGEVVAVHDAVRPLVSFATLERLFECVKDAPAVVPVVPMRESLRRLKEGTNKAVLRSEYFIVQTPQVFKRSILGAAYNQEFSESFTDDASVVESLDFSIAMVQGNDENIKITTPLDLALAEILLQNSK